MSKALKTKEERLSDSITILHKILEIGVEKDSTEYLTTKTHLDAWIASGDWSKRGTYPMVRQGLRAY